VILRKAFENVGRSQWYHQTEDIHISLWSHRVDVNLLEPHETGGKADCNFLILANILLLVKKINGKKKEFS
jgi:hypothetical protein